jgi:hypothetical protein
MTLMAACVCARVGLAAPDLAVVDLLADTAGAT